MAKKNIKTTEDMISSIIVENATESGTLEALKNVRNEVGVEPSFNNTPLTKTFGKTNSEHINKSSLSNKDFKLLEGFNGVLEANHYDDKKEAFLMSLSRECLKDYEDIANGITYKTDKKVSRNTIIRKVLEDFISRNGTKLENIINKL